MSQTGNKSIWSRVKFWESNESGASTGNNGGKVKTTSQPSYERNMQSTGNNFGYNNQLAAASNQEIIDQLNEEIASLQQHIGDGIGLIDQNVCISLLRHQKAELQKIYNKMEQEYRAQQQALLMQQEREKEQINRNTQSGQATKTRSNRTKPPTPPTWNNPTTKEAKAAYRAEALAYLMKCQEYVQGQVSEEQFKSEFSKLRTFEDFEDAFEPIKDEIERLSV